MTCIVHEQMGFENGKITTTKRQNKKKILTFSFHRNYRLRKQHIFEYFFKRLKNKYKFKMCFF